MPDDRPVSPTDRLVAAVVVVVAVGFVWYLVGIDPDPRGFGTHEQFGMRRCSWPEQYGIPCPTCGCTTAAAHLVHLSPWDAFVAQPFGLLVTCAGLWFAFVALRSLVRRESFLDRISLWNYAKVFLVGMAAMLVSWGYKILTWGGA